MHIKQLVEQMQKSGFYPHPVQDQIRLIQTNISYVFLTGMYVYKIKKPVNLGFLNYSSLERRRYFCNEEIRLNQKCTKGIYINVIPITCFGNRYQLEGDSKPVEYAIKMHQFPDHALLNFLIQTTIVTDEWLQKLVKTILHFHKSTPTNHHIQSYGDVEKIKSAFDENYAQTVCYIKGPQTYKQYSETKRYTDNFFKNNKELFFRRQVNNHIRDCHGNLHLGNVAYWNDEFHLFDRIEFNKYFRYVDVISDLAFLLMDLDAGGHTHFSKKILNEYLKTDSDPDHLNLLPLYLSRQAYVQAKITSFALNSDRLTQKQREAIESKAARYYTLAWQYTQR